MTELVTVLPMICMTLVVLIAAGATVFHVQANREAEEEQRKIDSVLNAYLESLPRQTLQRPATSETWQ